ncbi:RNA polymerase sigma factor [Chitinophaga agri]|uniref:Sigma-70 family RNA polymerase sigma factor n=1 Tax=Chitinophaga agri TaxID=2703787 RepID=A0A6B9Z893_9BACT|nr:sigma-70 family RNA polymerase sigma factor [Chitinophaga agri]QHS58462.1 sigma-70 family RNA polymerase sigma factor [Chitinophaga agri]
MSVLQLEDIKELIKLCAANDRLGQEKLYRKFYPALFLLCRKFFPLQEDALEALNDGMLKVFKNIEKYSDEKGEFFNWVYTIVRNTALDKLRNVSQPGYMEVDDMIIPDNDNPLKALESADIYKLLDVLPPATRAICILFYLEGFSIPQIGEQLDISAGTIKWHLSEVRKRMKPVLLQHYKN